VVKLLLETGKVKVDAKDKDGRAPLSWAAYGGHEAVAKLLLEISKGRDGQASRRASSRRARSRSMQTTTAVGRSQAE
jgi:ankyrin repeat protein